MLECGCCNLVCHRGRALFGDDIFQPEWLPPKAEKSSLSFLCFELFLSFHYPKIVHKKTCKSMALERLNVLENSVREFSLLELSWVKNPGIFCPVQNKILEFSPKIISQIPWQIGIPGIFWSPNVPSCNVLSGNFLSRNFVSRKIHGFV